MFKSSQHCQICNLCSRLSNSDYFAGVCKQFKVQEAPSQDCPIEAVPGASNLDSARPQAMDAQVFIKTGPSVTFHGATAVTATSSGVATTVPAGIDWLSLENSVVSSF